MDTSKDYIKMCEKAVEIQENHKQGFGDYFCFQNDFRVKMERFHTPKDIEGNEIWLPRQDQLQEMLDHRSPINRIGLLYDWFEVPENKAGIFNSIEQLWLAFVMKEKYSKHWSQSEESWVER